MARRASSQARKSRSKDQEAAGSDRRAGSVPPEASLAPTSIVRYRVLYPRIDSKLLAGRIVWTGMANTRNLGLLARLGLVALLASGGPHHVQRQVASPTPEIVPLHPRTSKTARPVRVAPGRRPASTFDDNDRGVLLLLLLSAQAPR